MELEITVIVLDQSSLHCSELPKTRYQQGKQKGLILFFSSPYSPQMNRIEDKWLHLKRVELAGRVFEDELDLAYALMAGTNNRAAKDKYSASRFSFNSVDLLMQRPIFYRHGHNPQNKIAVRATILSCYKSLN